MMYDSRSGSTMTSSLLERYEHVFVANESAFISRLLSLKEIKLDRVVDFLFEEAQFSDLLLTREEVEEIAMKCENDCKSFSEEILLTHFLKRYSWFEDNENQVIIVKHPPTNHLEKVEELWPNARALVIVRDGRDVAYSKGKSINLTGKKFSNSVIQAALNWKYKYRRFSLANWASTVVRYEDIISDSAGIKDAVISLGVSATISEREDKIFQVPKSQGGFHQNVGKRILHANSNKFESNGYINFVYSMLCKPDLQRYGYGGFFKGSEVKVGLLLQFFAELLVLFFNSVRKMLYYLLNDRHRFLMRLDKISTRFSD